MQLGGKVDGKVNCLNALEVTYSVLKQLVEQLHFLTIKFGFFYAYFALVGKP